LRPRDIVYAKGVAHGLRAFTLWLAIVPILTIPFLLGGVSDVEVLASILVNFSSICLAMAAGLLASTGCKSWTRAMGMAMLLSAALLILFVFIISFSAEAFAGTGGTWVGGPRRRMYQMSLPPNVPLLFWGFALTLDAGGAWWQSVFRGSTVLSACGCAALASLLALYALSWCAAWNVHRVWREQPASARIERLKKRLLTPVIFKPFLRRWLNWKLARNPIGWLEQRSWSGRLIVWSWLAIVVCIYSSLFTHLSLYQNGFDRIQSFLAMLLCVSMAISASGSFRREHETGVLELLLVAPLREEQIINGRIKGLWSQFLPAVALLFAVWLYCGTFLGQGHDFAMVLLYAVTFATLPIVGLYFSLDKKNFIAALLWTLLVQMVIPSGLSRAADFWYWSRSSVGYSFGDFGSPTLHALVSATTQIGIALYLAWRLKDNLKRRRFALDRAT
jgi:ABC-type transport system involved in multi-copper enzyme maturation permease subunit